MNDRLSVLRSLRVLFTYRARLWEGIVSDARQRYAGSVLGMAWNFVLPLFQLSIYTVVYVYIFRIRPASLTEYQYVVLVFSGLVPLLAFNESLTSATGALVANRSLLMNSVFPAELIPVRAAFAGQAPSIVGLAVTLVAGVAVASAGWRTALIVPVLWLLLLMLAVGLGWVLSLLTLIARDVQHGLGLVMLALFILSPFAYTPDMVPRGSRPLLYANPLSYYVLSFQQAICYGRWPPAEILLPATALSCICFFGGFALFHRMKYVFFDYA